MSIFFVFIRMPLYDMFHRHILAMPIADYDYCSVLELNEYSKYIDEWTLQSVSNLFM
jgi:hypothetical protein